MRPIGDLPSARFGNLPSARFGDVLPTTFGNARFLLLGASRGLGHAVHQKLASAIDPKNILQLSRQSQPSIDFSKPEHFAALWEEVLRFGPTHLWYFAGGGPYGAYGSKAWRDHQWAYRVNFETPAQLLHAVFSSRQLSTASQALPGLQQMIVVGSAVAGQQPDPLAASYSAAKHALHGLITSIQTENVQGVSKSQNELDLRLFSPGYMDTALLPASAEPRQKPGLVMDVQSVADQFLDWSFQSTAVGQNLLFDAPFKVPRS